MESFLMSPQLGTEHFSKKTFRKLHAKKRDMEIRVSRDGLIGNKYFWVFCLFYQKVLGVQPDEREKGETDLSTLSYLEMGLHRSKFIIVRHPFTWTSW